MATNSFRELLKIEENEAKKGYKNGAWFPHKSPEGGTRTLGYGHKLTEEEEKGNYVVLPNGKMVDFSKRGLTDAEVELLFDVDLEKHKSVAAMHWDAAQKTPFATLDPMHQAVLTEIAFNTGGLRNSKGAFGWPSLAKGILNNDQDVIKHEIMRSFTDEHGVKKPLTKRVNKVRGFIDNYYAQPESVDLTGFVVPQEESAPEASQDGYSRLLQKVVSESGGATTQPQQRSQPVTEPNPEEDKMARLMDMTMKSMYQDMAIQIGEKKLKQTYDEVVAEEKEGKKFSEEDEKKIQQLMEMNKGLGERVVLRETTNPYTGEEEQPEERENDPSKDPIYGIF